METTREECEANGKTWVEEGGEWVCKHPEGSEESSGSSSDDSDGM